MTEFQPAPPPKQAPTPPATPHCCYGCRQPLRASAFPAPDRATVATGGRYAARLAFSGMNEPSAESDRGYAGLAGREIVRRTACSALTRCSPAQLRYLGWSNKDCLVALGNARAARATDRTPRSPLSRRDGARHDGRERASRATSPPARTGVTPKDYRALARPLLVWRRRARGT